MSTSNHLLCTICSEYIWVGQSDYVYTDDETVLMIAEFLEKHRGHYLIYGTDIGYGLKRFTPKQRPEEDLKETEIRHVWKGRRGFWFNTEDENIVGPYLTIEEAEAQFIDYCKRLDEWK
jgi:hypothetical protein